MLGNRAVGEDECVVGHVEVLARAVTEVRAHDRDPPAGSHGVVHPAEECRHRLLREQVLQEVRHEHAVEVRRGQIGLEDVRDDRSHVRAVRPFGIRHLVDRPPLLRRHGVDELAPPGSRIEDRLRMSHQTVDERRDLVPDRRPGTLIDVAEAVFVEALVVHGDMAG